MISTMVTIAQHLDLATQLPPLHGRAWPRFLRAAPVAARYWSFLYTRFAAYQLVICDATGTVLAAGHTLPIRWDGTLEGLPAGWDAVLEQGNHLYEHQGRPTTLAALAVVVDPPQQGHGLSALMVRAMIELAATQGLDALLAPVRPTLKNRYPLTPMERYIRWTQAEGLPLDPWLRVHTKLGAEFLAIAPKSMVIPGTVAQWEAWTQMRLPESGIYIVPGALQPVRIDREQDVGVYEEPNVWMRHRVER
jgi:GNAT superfamily N-acetyltransferase